MSGNGSLTVMTADVGVPSRDQAHRLMMDAVSYLSSRGRGDLVNRAVILMAEARLIALTRHPSEAIRKHARRQCWKFGLVAEGFAIEGGAA